MNMYRDNANHLSCLQELNEAEEKLEEAEEKLEEEQERSSDLKDRLVDLQRDLLEERRNHRKIIWSFWAASVVIGTLASVTAAWIDRFDRKAETVAVPIECHDEAFVFPRMANEVFSLLDANGAPVPRMTNQYTVKCSSPQAKMEPTLTDDAIFWQCACPHKP